MRRIELHRYLVCSLTALLMLSGCSRKRTEKGPPSLYSQAVSAIGNHRYDDAESLLHNAIINDNNLRKSSSLIQDYLLHAFFLRQTGRYDSVAAAYEEAISMAHEIGDNASERQGKYSLAEFFLSAARFSEAADAASDAATLSILASDWQNAFAGFEIVRAAQHGMGKYDAEQRTLDSLTRIDKNWLNNTHARTLYPERFLLLRGTQQYSDLKKFFVQWNDSARKGNDTALQVQALISWGEYNESVMLNDSAFQSYSRALTILNNSENYLLHTRIFSSLGNISLVGGKTVNAVRYYSEAAEQIHQLGNLPLEEILSLQRVACNWLIHRKDSHDTTRYDLLCDHIRESFRDSGCTIGEPYANFLKGRILEYKGQLLPALRCYREAMMSYEDWPVLAGESFLSSIISSFMRSEKTDWYDAPLSVLCSVGNGAEAFELSEHVNRRELSSFFLRLPIVTHRTDYLRAIERLQWDNTDDVLVRQEIDKEFESGMDRNRERLSMLSERLSDTIADSLQMISDLNQLPDQFRWLLDPRAVSFRQIQDSLSSSDGLLTFVPLSKALYIVLVKKDTVVVRRANIARSDLAPMMNEYCTQLGSDAISIKSKPSSAESGRIASLSAILYSHFISPIQSSLGAIKRLYILQTKDLGWLPVHTLRGEGGSVVAKYEVHYLPASAMLLFPSGKSKPVVTVAGMGHPGHTGWDVEYELKDIRSFYKDAKMFFDTSATIERLGDTPYDVVHLCSELRVGPDIPASSMFVLSDGVSITGLRETALGEIFMLPPPGVLLFSDISPVAGEGARYLPAALLVNGSPTVIVSMWQGDRKTKKFFGEAFYTGLLTGKTPAGAYDAAVKKLSTEKEFASPGQWGVYYLFGK